MYNDLKVFYMRKILLILVLLSLNLTQAKEFKNLLQFESSPYLKQHESNKLEWMPWGEAAFERAKKENKAII